MSSGNTGMRDCFVAKGIAWHRGIWGADKPDGTGVITVWSVVTNGDNEMPFDREARRCTLYMWAQPGDEDWPRSAKGLDLIDRCRRSLAANRPLEVILRKGDRALDLSDEVYIDDRYYAVRVTYVGSEATGDLGTIKGDFLTQSEYERG